jgi:hypothetical protein
MIAAVANENRRRGRGAMPETASVFVMEPVLEICLLGDFALWSIADVEPYSHVVLGGDLTASEVGIVLASLGAVNDSDYDEDLPPNDVGAFLRRFVTDDRPYAPGGMQVRDTVTGMTFRPGCCNDLAEWRNWSYVLDGDEYWFGHSPWALARPDGDVVQLTVDGEPVLEVPTAELPELLAGAERRLVEIHRIASDWLARELPEHADKTSAAVKRALDLR